MEERQTKVGARITEMLEERGISIREFAIQMDVTYEHIRRIVRGESLPSKPMLRQMATYLKIEPTNLIKDLVADQISKKYGVTLPEVSSKKPGLEKLEAHWDSLSEDQKLDLTNMAGQWAKRSKSYVAKFA